MPGRPKGGSDARDRILMAAREAFAISGTTASMRSIAAAADVDPSLVLHYFGSKDQLFAAAMDLPIDPTQLVDEAFDSASANPGRALIEALLAALAVPDIRRQYLAIIRSAAVDEKAAALLRHSIVDRVIKPAIIASDVDCPELRTALISSQFVGLVFARHVVGVPPLAQTTDNVLATAIAPVVTHYLTAPIGSTS